MLLLTLSKTSRTRGKLLDDIVVSVFLSCKMKIIFIIRDLNCSVHCNRSKVPQSRVL